MADLKERVKVHRNVGGFAIELTPYAYQLDTVDKSVDYVNLLFDRLKAVQGDSGSESDKRVRTLALLQVAMNFIELRDAKESGVLTDKVEEALALIEQALVE